MSTWFDRKTGRVIPLAEMFERLTDEQLQGADYGLRLALAQARQGKRLLQEHVEACREVMGQRPGLQKPTGAS